MLKLGSGLIQIIFFDFYITRIVSYSTHKQMKSRTPRISAFTEDRLQLKSSNKKLVSTKRYGESSRYQNSPDSYFMHPSSFRNNPTRDIQNQMKIEDIQNLQMNYFETKYLLRDEDNENIEQQMKMINNKKNNEIESLRIHKDQLMLMSRNKNQNEPIKISIQTLKQKAQIQLQLAQHKARMQKQYRDMDSELEMLEQYKKFMINFLQNSHSTKQEVIDMTKEEQVMIRNVQMETNMLIKQLSEEQKRNNRDIKQMQDQILQYRVIIKEKEDQLRNLKAKICTLYIKLNSRNKSRSGSKSSRDRNMSLSIRKFNSTNHNEIKEAFIGNNTFKSYSKQIIEKVSSEQELVKIKFFVSTFMTGTQMSKKKEQLYFQCFYKGRDGQIHDNKNQEQASDNQATRDKTTQTSLKVEQIYVKYLFSMKFFYKSKIVGVQCRVKTDKGNKHIQIGICDSNIQHQLLTLVNKKIVTLASYWHGKQMVGISVWYSQKPRSRPNENVRSNESQDGKQISRKEKQKTTYDQYYS